MAFVKLDTGILDSTLWIERDQREVFITALLMAEPREFSEPIRQIEIGELEYTDFEAPPGWYGFVPAASFGIINRAGVEKDAGLEALRKLGSPEIESRSKEHEGRRMIRMNGGFIILNYMKYRDKDHTAALRQARLRARKKALEVTRDVSDVTRDATLQGCDVTQAEGREQMQIAEPKEQIPSAKIKPSLGLSAEKIYQLYPRHIGKSDALKKIKKALKVKTEAQLLGAVICYCAKVEAEGTEDQFIPHPATWFNQGRYDDDMTPHPRTNGGNHAKQAGADNQPETSTAESYATWLSMSDEFQKTNPWQGPTE